MGFYSGDADIGHGYSEAVIDRGKGRNGAGEGSAPHSEGDQGEQDCFHFVVCLCVV